MIYFIYKFSHFKQRRAKIQNAVKQINEWKRVLSSCLNEEEMAYDSLSEGLQSTMRGEEMEECIDILNESIDKIEEVLDDLEDI